jgi:type IV pilus assembly protein PilA
MCTAFQKQQGFTLIELMIIGILAAIAIPNFLQYQLKARQSEAKTSIQAIKTSAIAFRSERGCYIGARAEGAATATAGTRTVSIVWGAGNPASATGTAWCTAVFNGTFNDIGFRPSGNVLYLYGLIPHTVAAPGIHTTATSCALATVVLANGTAGTAVASNNNFVALAQSNLDGDGTISAWDSSLDHGAFDCTAGVY